MSRNPYDDVRILPRRATAAEQALIEGAAECACRIRTALAELRRVAVLDDSHYAQESVEGALTDGEWLCATYLDCVARDVAGEITYEQEAEGAMP